MVLFLDYKRHKPRRDDIVEQSRSPHSVQPATNTSRSAKGELAIAATTFHASGINDLERVEFKSWLAQPMKEKN
jgi:hypothetical protein